jgi:para-aminobenzoate synthetase component 1
LCASPERYIKKQATLIISNLSKAPSKEIQTHKHDEINKQQFMQSEKDRSENVMVVDL